MSRHESVSCDSCMKANFKGRRYKCLICYDYDLCSTCHEAGVTTGRHSAEHPMQCILTRADFELFYGGDSVSTEHPQSFTCPYCGNMGYTESTLSEHVSVSHCDSTTEVICPVCAALPGGDPNMVSDDFHAHMALEHRGREPFEVESLGSHRTRRLANSRRGARSRHYTPASHAQPSSNSSSLPMDPIAELLSHLSGVQTRLNWRNTPQQLRDLQMQIEAERAIRIPENLSSYREHIQRIPRRPGGAEAPFLSGNSTSNGNAEPTRGATSTPATGSQSSSSQANKSLLSSYLEADRLTGKALEDHERLNAEHSVFVQDVLLATLTDAQLTLTDNTTDLVDDELTLNSASLLPAAPAEQEPQTKDGGGGVSNSQDS